MVVKRYDDSRSVQRTVRNLAILAEIGVPVPEVVQCDDTRLVMTCIPGRDLHYELPSMSRAQLTELAARIMDIQQAVAALPRNTGCGYVGIGELATRTWSDVVRRPNGYLYADPLPADTTRLYERLVTALDEAEPYLSGIRPVCFLDDLTTKNVMINEGKLSGVVDLDWVAYGDPLLHLGLTAAAVTVEAPPTGRHYGDELVRFAGVGSEQRRMIDLYEAVYLVNFLGAEWPHRGGSWRGVAATAASERLNNLTSAKP